LDVNHPPKTITQKMGVFQSGNRVSYLQTFDFPIQVTQQRVELFPRCPSQSEQYKIFRDRARENGDDVAIRSKRFGVWRGRTWAEVNASVRRYALGIQAQGSSLKPARSSSSPIGAARLRHRNDWRGIPRHAGHHTDR
jgi:hypothetical protein